MTPRLRKLTAAIDSANSEDPNSFDGAPLAQVQGVRASHWLRILVDRPSDELAIAARAHHLRRWEIHRADYPEGRAGYLQWRAHNKRHQCACVAELLEGAGCSPAVVSRVEELLLRRRLTTDPETQTLEDVACLVFLETQLHELRTRLNPDQLTIILRKTSSKMSPAAVTYATELLTRADAIEERKQVNR